MRLSEITTNSSTSLAKFLLENCQQYLRLIGGDCNRYRLWHGDKRYFTTSRMVSDVRTNRSPLDSAAWLHNIANDFLANHPDNTAKIKFRSASVFASGSKSVAGNFGHANLIFPIGDFQFCWSPKVVDLTEEFSGYGKSLPEPEVLADINDKFVYSNYRFNEKLTAAIESKHEIMIACNQYVMVNPDHHNAPYMPDVAAYLMQLL